MNTRPNKTQLIKRTLIAVAALGTIGAAANSYAASTTANGTATVLAPITITKATDLDFGAFHNPGVAGTVVMAPAGTRSATGGVVLSSTDAGNAASFTIGGAANATYAVTLPTDGTITLSSGANTMALNTFTSTGGTLDGTGAETLTVGGTLTVGAAQAAGAYTGTFTVSVEYN